MYHLLQQYYEPDRNCVVNLIGKNGYQFEITVTKFDVEGQATSAGVPIKCHDYVKLYDGRLFLMYIPSEKE